jgi:hypothetical protein
MTELTNKTIAIPSKDIVTREIQGEVIIIPLDPESTENGDALFTLDAIGQTIWEKLKPGKTIGDIIQELQQEYEDPHNTIEKDVREFVTLLASKGILITQGE